MTSPGDAIETGLARLRVAGPPLTLAQLNQRVADIVTRIRWPRHD